MGCIRVFLILLIVYFVDGIGEGFEVLFDGLIHQHITVSQIKHFFHQFGLQQTIDNLEGGVGLTRTCRHHEQHTFIATCHRIHRTVDGIALIITRWEDILSYAVRLIDDFQFVFCDTITLIAFVQESGVKLFFRRELIHCK